MYVPGVNSNIYIAVFDDLLRLMLRLLLMLMLMLMLMMLMSLLKLR